MRKQCDLLFYCIVYKQLHILGKCGETGRFAMMCLYLQTNFILVILNVNFTFWAVLHFSSPWELTEGGFLFLFPEHSAQPGRACLLCFTPEFDKVLVSLAHVCLGASLCQIRVWSSANSWFPLVAPDLLGFWGNQLFGCPVSSPSL